MFTFTDDEVREKLLKNVKKEVRILVVLGGELRMCPQHIDPGGDP